MYSASLLAAIVQRLWRNPPAAEEFRRPLRLPADLMGLAGMRGAETDLDLPVILKSSRAVSQLGLAFPRFQFADSTGGTIGRGYASLRELVRFAMPSAEKPADDEYFDLATPTAANASAPNPQPASLQQGLNGTAAVATASALAIIVDSGVAGQSHQNLTPDDFNGTITHLVTANIGFSAHARDVLSTLVSELHRRGIASQVHIVCALVAPAPAVASQLATGSVLDVDNVVHLSDALAEVQKFLAGSALPSVLNLSLGTHVGPHLGTTPLETFVSGLVSPSLSRYVVAAAGNDGERGCHASCHIHAGDQDTLQILIGPKGARELLVEFWWEDGRGQDIKIDIDVLDANGSRIFTAPFTIDTATNTCPVPVTTPRRSQQVLVGSPSALNGMRCVAYALEASNASVLVNARIRIDISPSNTSSAALVHAWVILCDDSRTTWVPAESHGTVSVPSTSTNVIGVGGVDSAGRNWTQSSRGLSNCPANGLSGGRCWIHGAFHSPALAAQVSSIPAGKEGTSFSAPRVSVAVLEALLSRSPPANLNAVLSHLVGTPVTIPGGSWSPRRGYGVI